MKFKGLPKEDGQWLRESELMSCRGKIEDYKRRLKSSSREEKIGVVISRRYMPGEIKGEEGRMESCNITLDMCDILSESDVHITSDRMQRDPVAEFLGQVKEMTELEKRAEEQLKEDKKFQAELYEMKLSKDDVMDTLKDVGGNLSKNPHVTLQRAVNHPRFGRYWHQSLKSEIAGLLNQRVFVPGKLPKTSRSKGTPLFIVLDVKTDSFGRVVKFKCRCVLNSAQSKFSYSDDEKYSSVASKESFKALLSYGVQRGHDFTVCDIGQAYLHSKVSESNIHKEDVYVRIPGGVVVEQPNDMQPILPHNYFWISIVVYVLMSK